MSTYNMFPLRNKKNVNIRASKLVAGQMDFDHLLVHRQVMEFGNSTTLILSNIFSPIYDNLINKQSHGSWLVSRELNIQVIITYNRR